VDFSSHNDTNCVLSQSSATVSADTSILFSHGNDPVAGSKAGVHLTLNPPILLDSVNDSIGFRYKLPGSVATHFASICTPYVSTVIKGTVNGTPTSARLCLCNHARVEYTDETGCGYRAAFRPVDASVPGSILVSSIDIVYYAVKSDGDQFIVLDGFFITQSDRGLIEDHVPISVALSTQVISCPELEAYGACSLFE